MKDCIFKQKKEDGTPVKCNVVHSGLANYYTGIVTAGGNLFLTDTELIFEGHKFNVGRTKACIPVKEISDIRLTTKLCNVQHIVVTANNETHKFAVSDGDEWVKHIENIRQA